MKIIALAITSCLALCGCKASPEAATQASLEPLYDFTKAAKEADEAQSAALESQSVVLNEISETAKSQAKCLQDALGAQATADAEQSAVHVETLEKLNATMAELAAAIDLMDEPPSGVPEKGVAADTPPPPEASSVRPFTIDGEVLELEAFIAKWHNAEGRYKAPVPKTADETPTGAMVAHLVDLGVTEDDLAGVDYDTLDKLHNAIHEWQKAEKHVAPAAPRKAPSAPQASFDGVDVRTFTKQWYRGGAYWTHPGSVTSHLQSTHGVDPGVLSGMSKAQQEALHSALHEQERAAPSRSKSVVRSYSSTVPAAPRASSNCPGGVCPTGPQSTWGDSLRINRNNRRAARGR